MHLTITLKVDNYEEALSIATLITKVATYGPGAYEAADYSVGRALGEILEGKVITGVNIFEGRVV